ncbi:hypothetical protein QTO34_009786 [Cnephaeus nilssonii]|uniref:C2H2-type domain-containing protein n=1 Tax=Cnephaeus nilssonii TaxID=3371016 RepID=A0AA40HE50_CNENI|nr:hypothetical protein QTO34_009786 [Eptesicus nilssonii]
MFSTKKYCLFQGHSLDGGQMVIMQVRLPLVWSRPDPGGARLHPDPGPRLTRTQAHPDPGARGLTRIQGPAASPGPGTQAHPDPGPRLTRIQGPAASPGPGTQAHPDPGARGLTRTRDPGSPRSRGPRPHPDPGPRLTRTRGPAASPGPGTQAHPDPGARGLTRTRGQAHPDPGARGLTRTRGQAHPDPGARGLARIRGPAASPGPGARGLARIRGPAASPGSGGPRPRPDPGPAASPGPGAQAHPDPGARGLARTRGLMWLGAAVAAGQGAVGRKTRGSYHGELVLGHDMDFEDMAIAFSQEEWGLLGKTFTLIQCSVGKVLYDSLCQVMFFTYMNHGLLLRHRRVHTGEKFCECTDCGKSFRRSYNLSKHKRIHTGVKHFECSDCGKFFRRRSTLIQHHRLRTGEKPYECSDCGKSFRERHLLMNHHRSHTGEKPYECNKCGKCLSSKKFTLEKSLNCAGDVFSFSLYNTEGGLNPFTFYLNIHCGKFLISLKYKCSPQGVLSREELKAPCEEVYVKHMANWLYNVNYIIKEKGGYILIVQWGDESVHRSPFKVNVPCITENSAGKPEARLMAGKHSGCGRRLSCFRSRAEESDEPSGKE